MLIMKRFFYFSMPPAADFFHCQKVSKKLVRPSLRVGPTPCSVSVIFPAFCVLIVFNRLACIGLLFFDLYFLCCFVEEKYIYFVCLLDVDIAYYCWRCWNGNYVARLDQTCSWIREDCVYWVAWWKWIYPMCCWSQELGWREIYWISRTQYRICTFVDRNSE